MTYAIIACSPAHIARKRSHMAGRKFVFFVLVTLVVMSIVNLTIFSLKMKRTLLPWQISPLHPPTLTFQEMYDTHAAEVLNPAVSQYDLAQVYTGKAKDALDLAEPSMVVSEVIKIFVRFVKFAVQCL